MMGLWQKHGSYGQDLEQWQQKERAKINLLNIQPKASFNSVRCFRPEYE
jgi:hypothetical protein